MANKFYFLRIGSNSEKEYIKKVGPLFSGLIVRANYFESAPGMLSPFFLKFSTLDTPKGYLIDPVTYVFALDPDNESIRAWQKVKADKAEEKLRNDLKLSAQESIPSGWMRRIDNPTEKQKDKIEIFGIKSAYRKLADSYLPDHLSRVAGKRALELNDFNQNTIDEINDRVVSYQQNSLGDYFGDEQYGDFQSSIPKPLYIFSPYFVMNSKEWLGVHINIWNSFQRIYNQDNSAIIIQCSSEFLEENFDTLVNEISKLSVQNIFLWLNNFNEEQASKTTLDQFAAFITRIASLKKNIFNLYAGGLTPLLIPCGLSGMDNGPGYGLQKDAEPVKGGLPTAQFYIPTLHKRQQILASYELLKSNQIGLTRDDFLDRVCACPICKTGIKNGIDDMVDFYGEWGAPKQGRDGVARSFPTADALQRCNFHFMLSRLIEFRWLSSASMDNVIKKLDSEILMWSKDGAHLKVWKEVLEQY